MKIKMIGFWLTVNRNPEKHSFACLGVVIIISEYHYTLICGEEAPVVTFLFLAKL